jgi:hypothetical protein
MVDSHLLVEASVLLDPCHAVETAVAVVATASVDPYAPRTQLLHLYQLKCLT